MEKALLVTVKLDSEKNSWGLEDMALELEELVSASGAEVVDNITCLREKPTANFFIGSGKAQELAMLSEELNAATVIFSHDLSGTQQRNLEEVINRKTIDRTQLILDIFARHARTPEGKTQVELAQLQYLMPRLVGKGIILSRLGGGIGTRGPGEQKLEVDRRRIRKRIDRLKADLKQLSLHRQTLRKKRKEKAMPAIALVGYTNAGKSTLLNTLTAAGQVVKDSLFTTLDPLSKNMQLANGERVILSDTVGFLNNLPHHLIEAFKATLEEVGESDLLLHVVDVSNALFQEHAKAVFAVLRELKADQKPMITVLNKIDLLQDQDWLRRAEGEFINPVAISAKSGENLPALLKMIQENFQNKMLEVQIMLKPGRMDLVDLFYREGRIREIEYQEGGIKIGLELPIILYHKLLHNKEIENVN